MPQPSAPFDVTSVRLFIGVISLMVGMLSIGLAIPLVRGKIPMNEAYGVKIPKSFTSEENWYAINTFGGKMMIAFHGIPALLFGCIAFFLPFRSIGEIMFLFIAINAIGLGFCLYCIFRFSEKL
jgi:uncharacterized membrane protein HdeD (DUF308 family)